MQANAGEYVRMLEKSKSELGNDPGYENTLRHVESSRRTVGENPSKRRGAVQ